MLPSIIKMDPASVFYQIVWFPLKWTLPRCLTKFVEFFAFECIWKVFYPVSMDIVHLGGILFRQHGSSAFGGTPTAACRNSFEYHWNGPCLGVLPNCVVFIWRKSMILQKINDFDQNVKGIPFVLCFRASLKWTLPRYFTKLCDFH